LPPTAYRHLALIVTLGATIACSAPETVTWDAPSTHSGEALPGRLALDGDTPSFTTDTGKLVAPHIDGACAGSVRVALSGSTGAERYVAWWAPRADSSAQLLAARSTDGGQSWSAPERVDTADHHPVGCKRPAPAIAADSASGYVHVAYAMRDPQGAGVFFSHSMDRGRMFHSAVTIVYGERLSDVAIAARGDTVAVAYVDPSSSHPPLGLALSHTMGHIFENRLVVPETKDVGEPAVALGAGRVAVAWVHRVPNGAATVMSRVGRFGASREGASR
jgi:hypothetical protein